VPSQFREKQAEQIKALIAELLEKRVKDPRLGFVTVTDVRLTGDGREATVFYTVLGGEGDRMATAAALASAAGLLRSAVGKKLGMKFTPTLAFQLDAVEEDASFIEDALRKAREHDAAVAAAAEGKEYAGEADPYKHPEADE
jgi:ribosome-binding factor A